MNKSHIPVQHRIQIHTQNFCTADYWQIPKMPASRMFKESQYTYWCITVLNTRIPHIDHSELLAFGCRLQLCGLATFFYSFFWKGKSSDFTNWGWAVRPRTASRSGPGHPLVSLQACNTTIRCGPDDSWHYVLTNINWILLEGCFSAPSSHHQGYSLGNKVHDLFYN